MIPGPIFRSPIILLPISLRAFRKLEPPSLILFCCFPRILSIELHSVLLRIPSKAKVLELRPMVPLRVGGAPPPVLESILPFWGLGAGQVAEFVGEVAISAVGFLRKVAVSVGEADEFLHVLVEFALGFLSV